MSMKTISIGIANTKNHKARYYEGVFQIHLNCATEIPKAKNTEAEDKKTMAAIRETLLQEIFSPMLDTLAYSKQQFLGDNPIDQDAKLFTFNEILTAILNCNDYACMPFTADLPQDHSDQIEANVKGRIKKNAASAPMLSLVSTSGHPL